jgi:hypothetical protein
VNRFGLREDVFLHITTLHEYGFRAVAEGAALAVRVRPGADGPTVCEVRGWDYPTRPRGRRRTSHRAIAVAAGRFGPAEADDLDLRALAAALRMLASARGWIGAPLSEARWRG